AIGDGEALEDALDRGLVRLDGERVRAAHPLLAAAARKRAGRQERRQLHRARATDRPDEDVATAVAEAAAESAACGCRQDAVLLGEHALRLTPAESPARPERLLTLGVYLER